MCDVLRCGEMPALEVAGGFDVENIVDRVS